MLRWRGDDGQASVELVAAIPLLLFLCALVAQLAVAGYALWSAGAAARAGARAGYVGGRAAGAARQSLPTVLRHGARVSDREGVRVRVAVPRLIPGLPTIPVTARAGLDVHGTGG